MSRILALAAALIALPAYAAPFLVGDVTTTAADKCVYTRGTVSVESDVVTDNVRGSPFYGYRICLIDLASDPRTGTVYVAVKNSYSGVTSPRASYSFPPPPSAPANARQLP